MYIGAITPRLISRWWFQTFFIFTPTWGDDSIWRAYLSNGLQPPPSNISHLGKSNIIFKSALGRDMLVPKRLTTFPWKMVVGRLLPFWVPLYFSGPVSFGEATSQFCRDDISCGWVFSVSPWRCILKQKHTEMTDLEWFGCKDQREGIRGTESPNFSEVFGCL